MIHTPPTADRPPLPAGSEVVAATARLWLRSWHRDDVAAIETIFADPEVMRFVLDGRAWDAARTRAWLDAQIAAYATAGYSHYAIIAKSGPTDDPFAPIGFCGIRRGEDDGLCHTGWRLAQTWWGHGLAYEAARSVQHLAFDTLGLPDLRATALVENVASVRLMTKLGMRPDPTHVPPGGPARVRYRIDNPHRSGERTR